MNAEEIANRGTLAGILISVLIGILTGTLAGVSGLCLCGGFGGRNAKKRSQKGPFIVITKMLLMKTKLF